MFKLLINGLLTNNLLTKGIFLTTINNDNIKINKSSVSDEAIKIIDNLCEKFGIVINWTSDNVVPYIKELSQKLIKYEIATSIAWIGIALIILIVGLIIGHKLIKKYCCEGWIIKIVVIIVTISVIGCQTFDIITCLTFPEKIIVRELEDFSNDNNYYR